MPFRTEARRVDVGRALPAPGTIKGFGGTMPNRVQVTAVNGPRGDIEAFDPFSQFAGGDGFRRGRNGPFVVFADKDHGEFPDSGQVE